jgi:hypothetical protein
VGAAGRLIAMKRVVTPALSLPSPGAITYLTQQGGRSSCSTGVPPVFAAAAVRNAASYDANTGGTPVLLASQRTG